jgi:hypothetical protein
MENIIVAAIVGVAGVWGGFRLLHKRKADGCGSGCAGCSCPSKPRSERQNLVTLRR